MHNACQSDRAVGMIELWTSRVFVQIFTHRNTVETVELDFVLLERG
jgi:hypothetical protein